MRKKTIKLHTTKTLSKTKKPAKKTVSRAKTRSTSRKQSVRSKQTTFSKLLRWSRAHTVYATIVFAAVLLLGGFLYNQKDYAAATGGQIVGIGGKCIDNANNKALANNTIRLWACSGSASKWTWTGDGTIRTLGYCLSTKGSGRTSGTLAVLNKCTGAAGQKWALKANGVIVDTNSGLCLDDKSSGTANGNPIWIYNCNNSNAQKWNISKAVIPLTATFAAHSALPAGPWHTAKPTISVVSDVSIPEFGNWLQQAKTLLEQWYPVLGDYYAYPGYTPATAFTIKLSPTYTGVAEVSGTTITLNPSYFRTHLSDAGALIHESVHIVQSKDAGGSNLPGWIVEGEADFAREHIYNDRPERQPTAVETYLSGYSPAANLLYYVQSTYSPNFVNTLNTAGWNGTYSDDLFSQASNGKTIAQLWTAATGQPITGFDAVVNGASNMCIDLPYYASANKTRPQLVGCNGVSAQKWLFAGLNKSTTTGVIHGQLSNRCLSVADNGTANGTAVWYYDCSNSAGQIWTSTPEGTLQNPNSGKCLQSVGQRDESGVLLEIGACGTSTTQRWTLPPF